MEHGLRSEKFYASVVVSPAPVWVPSQLSLLPIITSVTLLANDNSDIEVIPGAVHRSPGIYFME